MEIYFLFVYFELFRGKHLSPVNAGAMNSSDLYDKRANIFPRISGLNKDWIIVWGS